MSGDPILEFLIYLLENPILIFRGFGFFLSYFSAYQIFRLLCNLEDHSHVDSHEQTKE